MLVTTVSIFALLFSATQSFLFSDFGSNVKFTLHRRNAHSKQVRPTSLYGASSFDPKAMTYFIIHGWNGGSDDGWATEMRTALLQKFDANVFYVDWSKWATTSNYFKAAAKCSDAGEALALFINQLESKKGASMAKVHLIGHSLGGQVAGFAGAKIQSPKLARITGLDTSGIGFQCLFSGENCLDPSDATFVDEIHTLISALPRGHADFYPLPVHLLKVAISTKIVNAHFLAIDYFIKSIQSGSCSFKSTKCTSQLTYMDGKCTGNQDNHVGFYATKPSSKPPNKFYMNIDIDKPC
ncbi:lipase member H-like [Watersipora subatra]|uniref:lipase member H-like n=1 Tax=Watersipora subatra TaxID=2589382 RepID=UPI00355C464A